MKRFPLLLITALFAGGIIAGGFLPVSYKWWLGTAAVCAAAGWLVVPARQLLAWILISLCGASLFACHDQIVSPNDLRLILGNEAKLASMKGFLTETPSYTHFVEKGREHFRTSCRMRVAEITLPGQNPVFAEGTILITVPARLPEGFYSGQTAKVEGVVALPPKALAPGLFDYRKYLAGQRTYYQLQCRETNDWKLPAGASSASLPWSDRFLSWGRRVTLLGLPAEDAEVHLLWAMSLGWRPGLNTDAATPFIRTGTMHIFAISGLHVALIAAVLVQLFRFVRLPRGVCAWVIIPLIWFYTAATGWQPSAIRSTLMSSIVVLGWSLKRPSNLLNSLMASALIILIWEPEQLFQASFQLSFFVVLSMALLLPARENPGPLNENPSERLSKSRWFGWIGSHPLTWRKRGWKPGPFVSWWPGDELLPPQLEPAWLSTFRSASQWVFLSVLTSLAAWIGSLPLIMYYFSIITPVSLVANLVVVPLSSLALACNLASLCTGDWFSGATALFNHAAWFFMLLMDKLSNLFSSWRSGYYYVLPPSVGAIIFYYIFLVLASAGCLFRARMRYLTVGVLGMALAIYCVPILQSRDSLKVTILPAGGGSILIHDHPAGERILVNSADERGTKMVLCPFLHATGINSIDSLLITHASVRHVGGTGVLLNDTPPRKVITSSQRFRSGPYNSALRELEKKGIFRRVMGENEMAGRWQALHPAIDSKLAAADERPLVFKGEYGGLRMLFLSDLSVEGQRVLMEKHVGELKTDLLIAGMPARGEPLSNSLLDAAAPEVIILCTSDYPAANRGSAKLRERLQSRGIPVYYLDETKAVTVTVKPNRFRLEAMNGDTLEWKTGETPVAARRILLPETNVFESDGLDTVE
jgi:competence protein ComEC